MPEIGRFFNVDPLAEKYSYQSPYNFQENKMGLGRELEGLEIALPPWIGIAGGSSFGTSVSSATASSSASFGATMSATSIGLTSASGTVGASISTTSIPLDQTIQLEEATISSSSKGGFWSDIWNGIKSGVECIGRVFNNDSNTASENEGVIYRVPESSTSTGKPYIGRTKQGYPSKRGGKDDGRDRNEAEVIDKYNKNDPKEGAYKEQKAIDENGGVKNLDNKRNEMSPQNYEKAKKIYGQ